MNLLREFVVFTVLDITAHLAKAEAAAVTARPSRASIPRVARAWLPDDLTWNRSARANGPGRRQIPASANVNAFITTNGDLFLARAHVWPARIAPISFEMRRSGPIRVR